MNIKDSIGLRIKTERERQQMSREVLCLDGVELTVRQLIRIEKGSRSRLWINYLILQNV